MSAPPRSCQHLIESGVIGDPCAGGPDVARAAHPYCAADDAVLEQISTEIVVRERSADDQLMCGERPAHDLERVGVLIGPAPRHLDERGVGACQVLAHCGAMSLGALPVLDAMP